MILRILGTEIKISDLSAMLSLIGSSAAFAPVAPAGRVHAAHAATVRMETTADLEELAVKCNPKVGTPWPCLITLRSWEAPHLELWACDVGVAGVAE